MKYRIVKVANGYIVQYKLLFWQMKICITLIIIRDLPVKQDIIYGRYMAKAEMNQSLLKK